MAFACLAVAGLAACGEPRQDEKEPSGRFQVSAESSFPGKQSLAKTTTLTIRVRNEETRRIIPNVAVTVHGFDTRIKQQGVADPKRPIFAINGRPKNIGTFPETKETAPTGGETAYVDTWALGALRPGRVKTFKWTVTAVRSGPYKLTYTVAAGLNGKARAAGVGGGAVRGTFAGDIADKAPQTRIADDGKTVIDGTR